MLIGAMNNPARELFSELRWMAEAKLDFIDLTLEPPAAAPWKVDPVAIRAKLEEFELAVVGHTAFYLPFSCTFESIRRAAVEETRRCIELFAKIGARCMNLHPDRHAPFHPRPFVIQQNLKSFRELLPVAQENGICLMVENTPGDFNSREQLAELLDALPELGLHLDIGHCNLMVQKNTATDIIRAYGDRIRHVHIHDNKGGSADLHLPLGAGTLELEGPLQALQSWGYDGTITLEVFSEDHEFLFYSRDVLRKKWDQLQARKSKSVPVLA
jgi:sugar phosphate isomerase/epimerase